MSRADNATGTAAEEALKVAPFCRERGGETALFLARHRARAAKAGAADALRDLPQGKDIENAYRVPVPPSQLQPSIGGELIPEERGLFACDVAMRDTAANPDYVTADASLDRLRLAENAGVLELALDAADTVEAHNSFEKMLAHQMAAVHQQMMKTALRLNEMNTLFPHRMPEQQRNVESCRLIGAMTRLTMAYQHGMMTLQRVRSGGRQTVVVKHVVQHVHVGSGGQAVVAAGKVNGKGKSRG